MAINILDTMIINRISAGEVVESPFSIVKELLDNSIDAKATKITVEIKNGGIDQIIVKDNGKGIEFDDIKKAFLPHATSKIKNIEDLDSIYTLGFRGEALASISNVSQTTMVTKTLEAECAYHIDVFGGVFSEIEPSTSEIGTKIEVNNLFFNTPARRKFLRSPKQEENQITNVISRYILAHTDISFKYIVNGKTIYQTAGDSNLLNAIYNVYGKETTQNIVYIEKEVNNIKLSGYVSNLGYSKPNTTYQTLILNSRYVIDETVSKAVYMAFEEYLMPRQFPFYVLNITMPAVDVDVNVHPNKLNIKFSNPSEIYDLVYTAIKSKIYQILNPSVSSSISSKEQIDKNLISTDINSLKEIEISPNILSEPLSKSLDFKQESYSPVTIFDLKTQTSEHKEQQIDKPVVDTPIKSNENNISLPINQKSDTNSEYIDVNNLSDFKIIGQIFNEFIILEREDNMLLLDFHAGHERLNYDKFCKIVEDREVVVQDLLIPYMQDLSVNELEFIMSLKDKLNELGFDLDAFGENKIVINSVPMQLKDINLKAFVDDLLHDMKNLKPTLNNEINHYLMQKACKSSVKSGQTLTEMEIKELLKNLDKNNPVLLCPHGRPVISVISKSQVEKWFKRIV